MKRRPGKASVDAVGRGPASVDLHFTLTVGAVNDDGSLAITMKTTQADALRAIVERLGAQAIDRSRARKKADSPRVLRPQDRPLPAGMTAWVSTRDVMRAVSCSRAKAHEYVRAAAGRAIGTGRILRIPVDVWEAWARANLVDAPRRERDGSAPASRGAPPAHVLPASPSRRRRHLGPFPPPVSMLPLIPIVRPRKRRRPKRAVGDP